MKLLSILAIVASISSAVLGCSQCLECAKPAPKNAWGKKKLEGNCPKVKYVKNFRKDLIDGVWYQHWGVVTGKQAGCDGSCVSMYAAPFNAENATLDYCCRKDGAAFCGTAVGSAVLGTPNLKKPGQLIYYFYGWEVAEWIVDVKYDLYLITYKCFYQGEKRTEIGEIWTRTPGISPCLEAELLEKLKMQFKKPGLLKKIDQFSNCPHPYTS